MTYRITFKENIKTDSVEFRAMYYLLTNKYDGKFAFSYPGDDWENLISDEIESVVVDKVAYSEFLAMVMFVIGEEKLLSAKVDETVEFD